MLKFFKYGKNKAESEKEELETALKYFKEGHLGKCMVILTGLASHHNAEAEYYIGDINEWTLDKPQEAATWYEKAAKHGHPKSKWCIANLFMLGKGVPKDIDVAMKWYYKAAESGVPEAMFTLGESYRTGIFAKNNQELARKYYQRSAESGYEPALKRYQQFYGELPSPAMQRKCRLEEVTSKVSSIQAVIAEAQKQGWLAGRSINFIPEIMALYEKAVDRFLELIEEAEPKYRETLAFLVSRYLFAKGVEGVILWGASDNGQISVFFHPKHLQGDIEVETPGEYRHLVENSLKVGESLFSAHRNDIMAKQAKHQAPDIRSEMNEVVRWMPRLGISYALSQKYQDLVSSKKDLSSFADRDLEALLDPHLYPFLDAGLENTNIFLITLARDEVLKSAEKQGLIRGADIKISDEALKALVRLVGDLREDINHYHQAIQKQIQLPLINKCFTYAFAKGAEYRFRRASGEEDPGLNYLGDDAMAGRAGAQVEPGQAAEITKGMELAWDVFCEIQDNIIKNSAYKSIMDGRKLADLIACLFFWAGVVGIEYAERFLDITKEG